MNIVLVIATLGGGGAERVITLLADELAGRGHTVSLWTFTPPEEDFFRAGPRVARHSFGAIERGSGPAAGVVANVRRVARIRRELGAIGADVVVSFLTETNVLVLLAMRALNVPVVVSERIDPRVHDHGRIWRWLRARTYPHAALVVTQTEVVARWCRTTLGLNRLTVIANPVATPVNTAGFDSMAKGAPGRDRTRPYILGAGRLVTQKGFDLLIRAFATLAGAHPELDLVIAGAGPEHSTLVALAAGLGIGERVALIGQVENISTVMAGAFAFILPSRYEGFPNVLLEALAFGVPSIAADCPSGPAEIVQNRINGLLVPVDDAVSLARAIDDLVADAALRARLSAEARRTAMRYTLSVIAAAWEKALLSVVTP